MRDTTRQKYLDAMNRRGDLIQQADAAFSEGNVERGIDLTNQAAAINPEIEGYRALMAQEEKFAGVSAPAMDREARDLAEERAEALRSGGRVTFSAREVADALGLNLRDSTTLATGTLLKPDRIGTTIHENVSPVSSIIDQVYVQDLTGCQSIQEPLLLSLIHI